MRLKLVLAALCLTAALPIFSQVAPAATEGGLPLVVGAGFSDYNTDWSGRLAGATVWADWNFYHGPSFLHGFGIEVEGRDLNYVRTGADPNLRQDTAGGGGSTPGATSATSTPTASFCWNTAASISISVAPARITSMTPGSSMPRAEGWSTGPSGTSGCAATR